jgi:hypothetical protein
MAERKCQISQCSTFFYRAALDPSMPQMDQYKWAGSTDCWEVSHGKTPDFLWIWRIGKWPRMESIENWGRVKKNVWSFPLWALYRDICRGSWERTPNHLRTWMTRGLSPSLDTDLLRYCSSLSAHQAWCGRASLFHVTC